MTLVVTDYVAPYNMLIHALKFQHQLALAPLFAHLLARTLQQSICTRADFIIPIPLSAQSVILKHKSALHLIKGKIIYMARLSFLIHQER